MPQPPYALLRASINGGAVQTGGLTIAGSSSVQLSADPAGAADVSRYKYEILDYPQGWPLPTGWAAAADGSYFYASGTTPPPFTVAAVSNFGKYMLRLTVDNGVSTNPAAVPIAQLVDEATCLEVVSASGIRATGWHETTQWGGLKEWVLHVAINWRLINAWINGGGGGGGGVTSHGALTDLDVDDHSTLYLLMSGTRPMTGALAMGAHKITGLATPTAGTDAATKAYVDSVVVAPATGIQPDGSVAFTANQPMGNHKLTGLATPTVSTDAATKAYADLKIDPAGGVAFTANQSMGGFKLTNLATPTVSTDAVTKAYADALPTGGTASIAPVACATTGNITLSGEQTLDGVTTSASRVLVWKQTIASQNGIYVSAAGAWARATDQDATGDFRPGAFFAIAGGTIGAGKFGVLVTPTAITVGTTSVNYDVTAGEVTSSDAGLAPAVGANLTFLKSSGTTSSWATINDFGAQQVLTTGGFVDTETGSGAERGFISYQASADANGARFVGKKSRGSSGTPTAHAADDVLLDLVGRGHDGSAFFSAGNVRIVADAAGGTSKRSRIETLIHDGTSVVTMSKTVAISPVTTAGATPTAIYTIQIPVNTTLSIGIRVSGKDASNNLVYQEWTRIVRRKGSANASEFTTPAINILCQQRDDAGAGFPSDTLNATSLDILVTGKAATSYTWTGCEVSWRELP